MSLHNSLKYCALVLTITSAINAMEHTPPHASASGSSSSSPQFRISFGTSATGAIEQVTVYDNRAGEPIFGPLACSRANLSPDGRFIFTVSQLISPSSCPEPSRPAASKPDYRTVNLYNIATGKQLCSLNMQQTFGVKLTSSSLTILIKDLAAVEYDKSQFKVNSVSVGKQAPAFHLIYELPAITAQESASRDSDPSSQFQISYDASAPSKIKHATVYDNRTGYPILGPLVCVKANLSPDGRFIYTTSSSLKPSTLKPSYRTVNLYDISTGKKLCSLNIQKSFAVKLDSSSLTILVNNVADVEYDKSQFKVDAVIVNERMPAFRLLYKLPATTPGNQSSESAPASYSVPSIEQKPAFVTRPSGSETLSHDEAHNATRESAVATQRGELPSISSESSSQFHHHETSRFSRYEPRHKRRNLGK